MSKKLVSIIRRERILRLILLLGPSLIFLTIFFLLPFVICFLYSFYIFGTRTFRGWFYYYMKVFQPLYFKIFLRTLGIAVFTTFACLVLGYPVAYCIALKTGRFKSLLITLVVLPYWVSFLLRTYALKNILARRGIINMLLMGLGIISEPLPLLYNMLAVIIGMIYNYLPFTILPLYASIEKLDKKLLDAARVLGANPLKTFIYITIPLTKPGIIAATILTFVPALGEFIVPALLGGPGTYFYGNIIWVAFIKMRNWCLGSAISIIFIVVTLTLIMLYSKYVGEEMTI